MGQNKNFIAARLPQELYDRLESTAGDKKGEKTQIIIRAIAAYLEFPLASTDTAVGNNERFVVLENRIIELEQQLQEFKEFVISEIITDNKTETSIIVTDNTNSSSDNSVQPDIAVDNKGDNKGDNKHNNKSAVPVQSDGSIGPAPESQIADFMGVNRSSLGYHRKTLKETGKALNQPKRVEYNSKFYNLICLGESKSRGKTIFLWTANPVIDLDNKVYQPDITEYQLDNNLLNALHEPNQEEQKQDSESLEATDNSRHQKLSVQPDTNQKNDKQDSQHSELIDNNSYPELSAQPDFNEKINEEQQDSGKPSITEHQSELPGEQQPEF